MRGYSLPRRNDTGSLSIPDFPGISIQQFPITFNQRHLFFLTFPLSEYLLIFLFLFN